ncbi:MULTISPECIES: PKD domain-containing protein [Chryseobacterium]|uniref:PKD domain-containing protein n=1 Tax=Chryseobacterium TaxID=59732 RepID=UPI000C9E1480|nr:MULTISPECIES: PKD domain-containing protein [Chryseobacterium]VXB89004.1 PKD domain-containing protein [Chryseobacterium sp. 8AT]
MKIKLLGILFLTVTVFSMLSSCRKVEEDVVDCLSESILTSLHAHVSGSNSKQVEFNVSHSGENQITSIVWTFGDGTTTTTSNTTVTHLYNAAGSYEVKAEVSINNGKCTVSPKKSVDIQ